MNGPNKPLVKGKKGMKVQQRGNKSFVPTSSIIKSKVLSTENSAFTKRKMIMTKPTE